MDGLMYPFEELIPIVAEITPKYCGYEHSSISYEKAQMLMEGVLYSIRECTQSSGSALMGNGLPAKEAYALGQEIVAEKVRRLQALYNNLAFGFQDYGSECLKDVITKGIPAFLASYDFRYAPQETLLTPDYPVLKDLSALSGIDAVLEYVECISQEQEFLAAFDGTYVRDILCAYHTDYGTLMENLCNIVLSNTVGHIILDKPLFSQGFCQNDFQKLEEILASRSEDNLETYVAGIIGLLAARYSDNAAPLKSYLSYAIPDLITRIQAGLSEHCWDRIFLL